MERLTPTDIVNNDISPSTEPSTSTSSQVAAELERQFEAKLVSAGSLQSEMRTLIDNFVGQFGFLRPAIAKVKETEDQAQSRAIQISHLEKDLEIQNERFTRLESQLASLKSTSQETHKELERTRQFLNWRSKELLELQVKYDGLNNEQRILLANLKTKNEALDQLQAKSNRGEEELDRIKNDFRSMESTVVAMGESSERDRVAHVKEMNEKGAEFQTQRAELEDSIQQLQEELTSLRDNYTKLQATVHDQNLNIEQMGNQRAQTESDLGVKTQQLKEAMDQARQYNADLKQTQVMLSALENEFATERVKWEAAATATLGQLDASQKELEDQTELFETHKSESIQQTGEIGRLKEQVDKQSRDACTKAWGYQLRLSASNYLLRNRGQLLDTTKQTLSEVMTLQKAKDESFERVGQEKSALASLVGSMRQQVEEARAKAKLLNEESSELKKELERVRLEAAQRSSRAPTPLDADAEYRELRLKYKTSERRLQDAVADNYELKQRLEDLEELEPVLLVAQRLLQEREIHLRELMDENADLKRRLYKW